MKKYFYRLRSVVKDQINKIILRGVKVRCDLCGWNGKRFPKNRCPKCGSLSRTRLIPFSVNYFGLNKDVISLLHVAPNKPEYNYVKRSFGNIQYDRLDIQNRDHINIVADLTNTNLASERYDVIILWHVLEHIPKDRLAIKEMHRILKGNGKILMSVPIYPIGNKTTFEDENIPRSEFLRVHGHIDHCRSCGLDYYKRFEEIGFITSSLQVVDLPSDKQERVGLSKNHVVWLFEKIS